ncbi:MAG: SUMF1/EgtB/PvdO family nonheme iron enzyme [Polyangiaceae bacterium]|nr:SUMF1/EgtB/PvdO family nonheme iron enzyme [Polyangiaceae bacterium]
MHVQSFQIDAYEVTTLHWAGCTHAPDCPEKQGLTGDAGRAVSDVTFEEAAAFCARQGGRLPTLDEFTLAMTGGTRRYPWGDTGLVCRRAAWGLKDGPCAEGGVGPDTAGSHAAGISREGAHDLAGNVAEWVISGDSSADSADVMGGSWSDGEAASLRGWNRRTVKKNTRDPAIGFRCVYTPGR